MVFAACQRRFGRKRTRPGVSWKTPNDSREEHTREKPKYLLSGGTSLQTIYAMVPHRCFLREAQNVAKAQACRQPSASECVARGLETPVEVAGDNECRRPYLIVVVGVPSLFVLELDPAYILQVSESNGHGSSHFNIFGYRDRSPHLVSMSSSCFSSVRFWENR